MTKVDEACAKVDKDLKVVFQSTELRRIMDEIHEKIGAVEANIKPIQVFTFTLFLFLLSLSLPTGSFPFFYVR